MPKKSTNPNNIKFLFEEFEKESDRASVILSTALIDESLLILVKSALLPNSSSNDNLFTGSNAPLGTFSSRIEISFRLGLISPNLARDLHILRKIRNSFAHNIHGCNFDNGSVKSRILELDKSLSYINCDIVRHFFEKNDIKISEGRRGDFLMLTGLMLGMINRKIEDINSFEVCDMEYGYGKEKTKKELEEIVAEDD